MARKRIFALNFQARTMVLVSVGLLVITVAILTVATGQLKAWWLIPPGSTATVHVMGGIKDVEGKEQAGEQFVKNDSHFARTLLRESFKWGNALGYATACPFNTAVEVSVSSRTLVKLSISSDGCRIARVDNSGRSPEEEKHFFLSTESADRVEKELRVLGRSLEEWR